MPTNLTLKGVPDEVYERLKESATSNHRSLNSEIIARLQGSSNSASNSLTKREHFAGLAMQAIIAKAPFGIADQGIGELERRVARGAVDYADALIAELAKGGE